MRRDTEARTRRAAALGMIVAAALAGALLEAPPGARADDAPKPLRSTGKVKSVAEGGAGFDLTVKGGALRVEATTETAFILAYGISLGELDGVAVSLLARLYQDEESTVYNQVHAIVAGAAFKEPADAAPLPKGVVWTEGTLTSSGKGGQVLLGRTQIVTGGARLAWMLKEAKAIDVSQGNAVLVEGAARQEGKQRIVAATRVVILGPKAPLGELEAVFGPLSK